MTAKSAKSESSTSRKNSGSESTLSGIHRKTALLQKEISNQSSADCLSQKSGSSDKNSHRRTNKNQISKKSIFSNA